MRGSEQRRSSVPLPRQARGFCLVMRTCPTRGTEGLCPHKRRSMRLRRCASDSRAATIVVSAEYRGLSVKEMTALRRTLRDAGLEMQRHQEHALPPGRRAAGNAELTEIAEGPTALAISYGDMIDAAKACRDLRTDGSGRVQAAPRLPGRHGHHRRPDPRPDEDPAEAGAARHAPWLARVAAGRVRLADREHDARSFTASWTRSLQRASGPASRLARSRLERLTAFKQQSTSIKH